GTGIRAARLRTMTVMSTAAGTTRPAATLAAAGDLLRALAAPVRIAIVLELLAGRQCVHDLVDAIDDFRSAQEIHEQLRRGGDGIGLTTVYRTLQALADGGEVDVLRSDSGEAVYRRCATVEHHHHLVCRRCGAAVEIE